MCFNEWVLSSQSIQWNVSVIILSVSNWHEVKFSSEIATNFKLETFLCFNISAEHFNGGRVWCRNEAFSPFLWQPSSFANWKKVKLAEIQNYFFFVSMRVTFIGHDVKSFSLEIDLSQSENLENVIKMVRPLCKE